MEIPKYRNGNKSLDARLHKFVTTHSGKIQSLKRAVLALVAVFSLQLTR